MTKGKSIIVTVEDAALEDIHDLANRLRVKGMSVDRVMPVTGVITGTCHSSKIPTLQKVQGVSAVEEEVKIQLPGPDAPVQ